MPARTHARTHTRAHRKAHEQRRQREGANHPTAWHTRNPNTSRHAPRATNEKRKTRNPSQRWPGLTFRSPGCRPRHRPPPRNYTPPQARTQARTHTDRRQRQMRTAAATRGTQHVFRTTRAMTGLHTACDTATPAHNVTRATRRGYRSATPIWQTPPAHNDVVSREGFTHFEAVLKLPPPTVA